jgi:hypothetical protein
MRDQVSHPYKTTGRIMVLYILTFTFLESRRTRRKKLQNLKVPTTHSEVKGKIAKNM